jgi:hypothetical protein
MSDENISGDVPISNWTLATGTKPGARDVYSPPRRSIDPREQPATK